MSSETILSQLKNLLLGPSVTPSDLKDHLIPSPSPRPSDEGSPTKEPRQLTGEDISNFERAATERRATKVASFGGGYNTPEEFLEYLKVKDPFRFRSVRRDMAWVRREARRAGFPESAIPWEMMG